MEYTRTHEQRQAVESIAAAVAQVRLPASTRRHFLMQAVAGAGKTSTLVDIAEQVLAQADDARILLLAFNVDMAKQLRDRLSEHVADRVQVHTLHAFGLRTIIQARPATVAAPALDPDKLLGVWRRLSGHGGAPLGVAAVAEWRRVRHLVGRDPMAWGPDGDAVRHGGWIPDWSVMRPLTLADAVLEASAADRDTLDQEDQVYHCVYHRLRVAEHFDLVLVDEAQDLNGANIAFIRSCLLGGPEARTVVCAVGDPAQAIYAFRGASIDAMDRFQTAFDATTLRLTCCFRCPRRVVFVASHLNPMIRARPDAPNGQVDVVVSAQPWDAVCRLAARVPPDEGLLLLVRNNRTILQMLKHLYAKACPTLAVRWSSPGVARQLRDVTAMPHETVGGLIAAGRDTLSVAPGSDRTVHAILETAALLEGQSSEVSVSPWMRYVLERLESTLGR